MQALARNSCLVTALLLASASLCGSLRTGVACQGDAAQDTAALISATSNCGPGQAVMVSGTCLVSKTVVLKGGCSLIGGSRTGTVLQQANGSGLLAVVATSTTWNSSETWTGTPTRVAHLTIDGSDQSSLAALVVRSWLTTVEDIHVVNSAGDGILVTDLGRDGTTKLKTSQVNGAIQGCFVESSAGHGIHVRDLGNSVTDWYLLNNWVSTSAGSAIFLENAAGWQIRNNHIYGNGEHGIFANRAWATSIDANYVEDFGLRPSALPNETFYGIACIPQGATGSVISGNKVFQLRSDVPRTVAHYVFIGVPAVHGVGMLNVLGNIIRGNVSAPNDTGMDFRVGSGNKSSLVLLSQGNNVLEVSGSPRHIGEGVTLVKGI